MHEEHLNAYFQPVLMKKCVYICRLKTILFVVSEVSIDSTAKSLTHTCGMILLLHEISSSETCQT